jgi:hypothetical protein
VIWDVPLALAGPQGMVGIRVTTGSLRNCALFDGPTIRKDAANRFVAKGSSPTALPDCSRPLPPPPTTTTTSTSSPFPTTTSTTLPYVPCLDPGEHPSCAGSCSGDDNCWATLDFFVTPQPFDCSCFPPGVIPCYPTAFPTCGGACVNGGVCQPLQDLTSQVNLCGCVDRPRNAAHRGGPEPAPSEPARR